MDRIEFLKQGLNCNDVQATLISELIKDIPDNKLKDFLIFRMNFIEPKMSSELITKNALFEYRRLQIEQRLKKGEKVFKNIDEIIKFVKTYYKNKDLGSGLGDYYDYVIIAVDENGDLINKFVIENGKYKKLTSAEEAEIYKFLLENQHKIGDIKYYTQKEIEDKKREIEEELKRMEEKEKARKREPINRKVLEIINKITDRRSKC